MSSPPSTSDSIPPATNRDGDDSALMGNSITGLLDCALDDLTEGTSRPLWETLSSEQLKRLLPAYEIQGLLGCGGMGMVYKAYDTVFRQTVAIKLLPPVLAADAKLMLRFKREAQVLKSLDHPGIVKVHSFTQTGDGHAYFVMDFVEGKTIHELVRTKQITVRRTLKLVIQICHALQYAHGKGVIHRDIKPSNILVDDAGKARLVDFGIAGQMLEGTENLTLTGQNPGTPFYIAPELYRGAPPTASSDIYSLGVTFYEMLTGERPHIQAEPPSARSSADGRVDKVVFRALKEKPAARYQNADEMRKDVERCSPNGKRPRLLWLGGIAAALVLAGGAALIWMPWGEGRPATDGKASPPVAALPEPAKTAPPPPAPDEKLAPLEEFTRVLRGYWWSYHDSLYPNDSKVRFTPDGKFHDQWHWNYWIVGPGVIHVQYWDDIYKPATAYTYKFNEDRREFYCEYTDERGRVHQISGTRMEPLK